MPRPTIFDYNGVLVDDEWVHCAAFREVLAPLGIAFGDAEYRDAYLGFDDAGAFEAILRDAGRKPTPGEIATLVDCKRPVYLRLARERLVVFDGAADLVRRRAARGPVAVVSGALRHEIDLGLGLLGVRDAVAAIVAAEDVARGKPDPEGYLRAVAGLAALGAGADARAAVAIEDSLAGVRAAKAAGLRCVAVCHSYAEHELRAAGADRVVARVADVADATIDEGW